MSRERAYSSGHPLSPLLAFINVMSSSSGAKKKYAVEDVVEEVFDGVAE